VTTNLPEDQRVWQADYRKRHDRVEVYLHGGENLRERYRKAIAPKSMREDLQNYIEKTVKKYENQ